MVSTGLSGLYRDAILNHCRRPRNQAPIESPNAKGHALNPLCGDEVTFALVMSGGRVSGVSAKAVGCAINQATASMLSEAVKGKGEREVRMLISLFKGMMQGDGPSPADLSSMGDLTELIGVREHPARIKCALLAFAALENGVSPRG
ncbi:MAG: SUF system NifU family Fe-S cluster assembly protein [SAR202 cluster bacterium]|nr:SUF system NifU family Fe-S cluster assembly protein [SAR202 cluster bacterium]